MCEERLKRRNWMNTNRLGYNLFRVTRDGRDYFVRTIKEEDILSREPKIQIAWPDPKWLSCEGPLEPTEEELKIHDERLRWVADARRRLNFPPGEMDGKHEPLPEDWENYYETSGFENLIDKDVVNPNLFNKKQSLEKIFFLAKENRFPELEKFLTEDDPEAVKLVDRNRNNLEFLPRDGTDGSMKM